MLRDARAIPFSARRLEREACVKLNLTPSADGGEYSADVVGEVTRCILKDGVSVSSHGKRTLRVTRDCKIRMIQQIVGFHPKRNLLAFWQLEAFLQPQIKLRKRGTAQDVTPSSAKLTGRW